MMKGLCTLTTGSACAEPSRRTKPMMARVMASVLMLSGLIAAPAAHAVLPGFDDGGLYAQAFIGGSFGGELEESSDLGTFVLERDATVVGGGAIGYLYAIAPFVDIRAEVEGSFSPVNVDAPAGSLFATSDVELFSVLANLWFDLDAPILGLTPYAGGGIGLGVVNFDGSNNTETGLAYQVGGGVLSTIPGTPFFVGLNYRYFQTTTEVENAAIVGVTGLTDVDVDLDGHRGTVSLGIQF
ncbi:MAG: outer membrane protein [Alphaproteobacteria bacterium]